MPIYAYECVGCGRVEEQARRVAQRDAPGFCGCSLPFSPMLRVFTPTANIHVGEHFRYLQSEFQPPKGDKTWEYLGRDDQLHAPPKEPGLREHLLERFRGRLG